MKTFFLALSTTALLLTGCSPKGSNAQPEATPPQKEGHLAETHKQDSHAMPAKTQMNTCMSAGPQTPRDIASKVGTNTDTFPLAPAPSAMNLCNIHTHTNAEHKAPGYSIYAGDGPHGGYQCNDTGTLSAAELTDPSHGEGAFKGVKPGDTIEVHWVHTSCDVEPGQGLGSCSSDTCTDPLLRVEAQSFLLVNDPKALDFANFTLAREKQSGHYQAKSLPKNTGTSVVFRGSTTGPKYTGEVCSPMEVTWSVRPNCTKLDISSLHRWAAQGNVFKETESHGVRQLITNPKLLSPIQ